MDDYFSVAAIETKKLCSASGCGGGVHTGPEVSLPHPASIVDLDNLTFTGHLALFVPCLATNLVYLSR